MSKGSEARVFSRAFKLSAVRRMLAGENVSALARELAAARQRIAELEAKIGRQALELDFFQRALRQVGEARQGKDKPGATPSTPSSKR